MKRLMAVSSPADIKSEFKGTPIAKLLGYHNLKENFDNYQKAEMLIGMCMDNRKYLHIPENFAYILRTGGGNLRYSEFKVSYAIAIGGIKSIALLAHSDCGMVNLFGKRTKFVNGLVEKAGWDREWAEEHFMHFAPMFEIGNEIDFVLSEAKRLRMRYPNIQVAPLYYNTEDGLLYQISE